MIWNSKYIGRQESVCPINLGIRVDPFGQDDEYKVCNEIAIGVSWQSQGKEITFTPNTKKLSAYPTPDMSKMVVIYCDEEIDLPNNAVVLNEDGSRHCRLAIPERLSKRNEFFPPGKLTGFMQAHWVDTPENMGIDLYIGDGIDHIETRLLKMFDFTFDQTFFDTWIL